MKKALLILCMAVASLNAAEGFPDNEFERAIVSAPEDAMSQMELVPQAKKIGVYPYLGTELIMPTAGVCFRTERTPVRWEANVKMSSLYILQVYSVTFSALPTLSFQDSSLYAGVGGGVHGMLIPNTFMEFVPGVSFFIGRETERGFFDVGLDILVPDEKTARQTDDVILFPTFRYGWHY